MAHRIFIAVALFFLAPVLHAAVSIPAEAIIALQAGKPVNLIVEYKSDDIDMAARRQRAAAVTHDTPEILTYRSQRYQQRKEGAETRLGGAPAETRGEYSHLPIRLKRFRSLAALNAWAADSQVRAIHLDRLLHPALTYSLPLIEEPAAASEGYIGTGTTVAVIDNGIDYSNAAFGGCTAPGTPATCRVTRSLLVGNATGTTDNSHGTNVSAIVAGVAPGTGIAMLNAFSGGSAHLSDVIAGINWSIANRSTYNIASINMSLSDGSKNTEPCSSASTNPFVTPVANAINAGITVVAAAGNEGYTNALSGPACVSGVISVGAVYSANWGGVNWGAKICADSTTAADKVTCFSNSGRFLTMLAPGAVITAGGIQESGTSQASPHVAGAVAVLRAAIPSDTLAATQARLTANGIPVTDSRNGLTKPRLNLRASIRPGNDNFSARFALNGSSGTTTGNNQLATSESGESTPIAGAGGHTVWWKWLAPAAGQATFDTTGSSFDTVLTVYANATSIIGLIPLANNDNAGSSTNSRQLFDVAAGTEYEISVDGMADAEGAIALNWNLNTTAVANLSISLDGPTTATIGTATDYTVTISNAGPQTAISPRATISLPANATFVSSSSPCSAISGGLSCPIADLSAGSSTTLKLSLLWTKAGTQPITVTTASDLPDTSPADNSATLAVSEWLAKYDGDVPTLPQWAAAMLAVLLLASSSGKLMKRR